MRLPHLVLVGGGHAHLRVIQAFAEASWPARCTLISPEAVQLYSGMVPGFLQGTYRLEDLELDLRGLCDRAGIEFVEASAVRIDSRRRVVEAGTGSVCFDFASVDIGSVPAGLDLPGVRRHALTVRPMSRAIDLRERVDRLAERAADEHPVRVAVVGAGAAGLEIALALHRRVARGQAEPYVSLLEARDRILPGYGARARRLAEHILGERGVSTLPAAAVSAVRPEGVDVESGPALEADIVVWATGSAPPPVLGRSILPLSPDGYFSVDTTLRARDGTPVWGAGDCIDFDGRRIPRAGVHAVRQGPVLAHNLRAAIEGTAPRRYRPQSSFLSLLNTADGKAILRWRIIVLHWRGAWWLKDWIDRRFVRRYQVAAGSGR